MRATIALLTYAIVAGAAHAAPECHIVYADDRPSTLEIREHEIAHCNGWEHKRRDDFDKPGYRAEQAPAAFKHAYRGELYEYPMSTHRAKALCGGHLGCQWFERGEAK